MQKSFEYLPTVCMVGNLDVEDIGDCIIKANNDLGIFYYLWVKTNYGESRIFELGPIVSEDNTKYLVKTFKLDYRKTTYTEPKLIKAIQSFLNNPGYQITQAITIPEEQLKEELKGFDIFNFMRNWDE